MTMFDRPETGAALHLAEALMRAAAAALASEHDDDASAVMYPHQTALRRSAEASTPPASP